jgi:hypothetical protein
MRRRTLAALGAGASASIAAAATAGLVGGTLGVVAAPPPPASAATGLTPFTGCAQLRDWYVEAALPQVTAWGWGWGWPIAASTPVEAGVLNGRSAGDAVGNGDTGTNLQEVGVDEADVAKTDGRLVAHVRGGHVVLTDTDGGVSRRLSRFPLPRQVAEAELLLVGDRLVVLGRVGGGVRPVGDVEGRILPQAVRGAERTRLLVLDVSDPRAPTPVQETTVDGSLLSAREHDGTVRLALSGGLPDLPFVHPGPRRGERAALAENRKIVRESTIEDWLPRVGARSRAQPLLACTDVHHPRRPAGFGTISVVTLPAADPAARSATAVTAAGDFVYSSADRLYVATAAGGWAGEPVPLVTDRRQRVIPPSPRTEVHAFALDGTGTEYVASGVVPGRVRDRWSFSEHDGHLRVATSLGRDSWTPRENAIVVLAERDGRLVVTGRVDGMGRREQIRSVRWFDDLAVLVTFRQVDPLYTVDLADPASPRLVGQLKIPGFSSYLHPLGADLLLGLGQDANRRGSTRGAQAAVFDLSDLSSPERVDTVGMGRSTDFAAAWDARAFTFLPEARAALAPLHDHRSGQVRVAVLRIGEDGTVTARTPKTVPGWNAWHVRALPLDSGRVAVVTDRGVTVLPV